MNQKPQLIGVRAGKGDSKWCSSVGHLPAWKEWGMRESFAQKGGKGLLFRDNYIICLNILTLAFFFFIYFSTHFTFYMWDVICFLVLHQSSLFWGSILNLMTSSVIKPFSPPYTACCFQAYRHSPIADLSSHKIPLITLLPSWLSPFALFSLRAHQCCFFLFSAVRSWKTLQNINWPPKQRFLEMWCRAFCAIFGTALFGAASLFTNWWLYRRLNSR